MGGEFSIGDIVANIKANITDFQAKMGIVRDEAGTTGDSLGSMASGLATALGSVVLLKDTFGLLSSSVTAFGTNQAALAQINQVLESTGKIANISSGYIQDLAMKMENYSGQTHESIMAGQTILLQFDGMTKGTLPQATQAMVDLAQRMGVSSVEAAKSLGIALQDPATGFTRLRREGIAFTSDQIEAIKTLEKSGDQAGATALLMQGLEAKIGGAAGAFRNTLPGSEAEASAKMTDLKESVGGLIAKALEPLVEKLIPILTKMTDWVDKHQKLTLVIVAGIASFVILLGIIGAVAGIIAVAAVAFSAAGVGIALAIAGITAAVIAVAVAVALNFGRIESFLKGVWNWIAGNWPMLALILSGPFGIAIAMVISSWNGIVGFFRAIIGGISNALSGVWSAIVSPFTSAFDAVKNGVKDVTGALGKLNPFARHSPSLFDLVQSGTQAISDQYIGMFKNIASAASSFAPTMAQNIVSSAQTITTNVNGPVNIGSTSDADYFFKRLTRGQELARAGMAVPNGGLG